MLCFKIIKFTIQSNKLSTAHNVQHRCVHGVPHQITSVWIHDAFFFEFLEFQSSRRLFSVTGLISRLWVKT